MNIFEILYLIIYKITNSWFIIRIYTQKKTLRDIKYI